MQLGVDVGGTFTDAVLAGPGELYTAKVPTTPDDQSRGVLAAVEAVLARAGREPAAVGTFAHGMTVATNALLEGRSARTALLATAGFTDLVALGRQNRPELYRLCAARPAPLVPSELRLPVPERMTPDGALRALTATDARRLAREVRAAGVEAVAVCLLHSYRHPDHERRLAEALTAEADGIHVSLSHELVGTFREFERAATTEVDAALSPLLRGYLRRLDAGTRGAGLPGPAIMSSAGGLLALEHAAAHAALTVLSGPAGGAAGAADVAARAGEPTALCFDMGGTSCDVCVVDAGRVAERSGGEIAGRPIALPMLAIHTVGAGGGSIAWRDAGGALRVGPASAGAEPGPAAYGRGGHEPTVTDANVVLGRVRRLAGGVTLDCGAAEAAVGRLADGLGLPVAEAAAGIVRVAVAEMVRALRVVTVERGLDPRGRSLIAFGGAGGLHACAVAEALGMTRVLCPRAGGVLAAIGLVIAPARRDAQQTVMLAGRELTANAVARTTRELAARVSEALGDAEAIEATYELRYRGQAFELPVAAGLEPSVAALRDGLDQAHNARFGFDDPAGEPELVAVRVTGRGPAPPPAWESAGAARGQPVHGPDVIELRGSTVWVPEGWHGRFDDAGTLRLERR